MESLLPCPYCGGKARVMLEEEDRPDDSFHNIYCTECGAMFWVKSKTEAIAKWNRRAESNEIARLRAELDREREIKEAAIIDIHEMLKGNTGDCAYCKFKDAECSEKFCIEKAEWRGKEDAK